MSKQGSDVPSPPSAALPDPLKREKEELRAEPFDCNQGSGGWQEGCACEMRLVNVLGQLGLVHVQVAREGKEVLAELVVVENGVDRVVV